MPTTPNFTFPPLPRYLHFLEFVVRVTLASVEVERQLDPELRGQMLLNGA
jgi:hypothetical protein